MADKRKVLKSFRDGQDRNRPYGEGGLYPRNGLDPSDERMEQLAELGFIEGEKEIIDENNTNDEIRAELDRQGIEWKTTDNKKDLLARLNDADGDK